MNTNGVSKEDARLKKQFTPEEVRINVIPSFITGFEPDEIFKKLSQKLWEFVDEDGLIAKDKDVQKLLQEAVMVLGLDNHHSLIWAMKDDYRPLAIEFTNSLNKEYDCKTSSEKALSQVVVNAFVRLLDDTSRYNSCTEAGEYLSENRTKHLAMLSKQIDRANRQFISALTALKQFKSLPIQVSIKTNTAFVAQNQQFNNIPPNEIARP